MPVRTNAPQADPKQSVGGAEFGFASLAFEHGELMPEGQILEQESGMGLEASEQATEKQQKELEHDRPTLADDIQKSTFSTAYGVFATHSTFQMVQLWVNLRADDKGARPRYQNLLKVQIPIVSLPENGGSVRVIAGEYRGQKGPAKTFTPINLWDVDLHAGKSVDFPLPTGHTSISLLLSGEVNANGGSDVVEGDLAIFAQPGDGIAVKAKTDAKLLVMDGEPITEPVVGRGPFVMNTHAEIERAFEEYQLGLMGKIVGAGV